VPEPLCMWFSKSLKNASKSSLTDYDLPKELEYLRTGMQLVVRDGVGGGPSHSVSRVFLYGGSGHRTMTALSVALVTFIGFHGWSNEP
jgi:hypothetical protein